MRATSVGPCMSAYPVHCEKAGANRAKVCPRVLAQQACLAVPRCSLLSALVAAPTPPCTTQPTHPQDDDDLDALTRQLPRLQVRAVHLGHETAVTGTATGCTHWMPCMPLPTPVPTSRCLYVQPPLPLSPVQVLALTGVTRFEPLLLLLRLRQLHTLRVQVRCGGACTRTACISMGVDLPRLQGTVLGVGTWSTHGVAPHASQAWPPHAPVVPCGTTRPCRCAATPALNACRPRPVCFPGRGGGLPGPPPRAEGAVLPGGAGPGGGPWAVHPAALSGMACDLCRQHQLPLSPSAASCPAARRPPCSTWSWTCTTCTTQIPYG